MRWIIGLSSGSGLDGVESALVEVQGVGLEMRLKLAHFAYQVYPRELCELMRQVASAAGHNPKQTSVLHRLLGETFAVAARQVADQAHLALQKVQCLGVPGHTIWHDGDGRFPSLLNLGMAAIVAERTGLSTVSDFRSRDLAAAGQAFPLTPLVDFLLFRDAVEHRVLVHLGGIATLVSLPAGGHLRRVTGFQAAPCNTLLDSLMRQVTGGRESFDTGGKHAVQGRCIEPLLERWLNHPLIQKRPPKSISCQAFGEEFVAQAVQMSRQNGWSLHDLLCTATHFAARSILSALRFLPEPPARILLSGGGVRNGFLWHLLQQQLPHTPLEKTDAHGIPAQARKAVAAAGLAALSMDNIPGNLPGATGAVGGRLLGSITPGSSANWARCLAWMASQAAPPLVTAA
jgi:anhydro-N-acetylmuramic acid kinase